MTDDFKMLFSNVSTGINQITKIVHSLRLYSQEKNGNSEDAPVNSLNSIIDSILTIMHHRFNDKISIENKIPPDTFIKCHAGQISQVFINIISNSIHAIEDAVESGVIKENQGKITILAELKNGHINITTIDNGIGMEKPVISRIFDPFFTTKKVGRGTGLGLSICQSIIKDHNGIIEAESNKNSGTSVIVSLPASGV
jgi:signal transduction histidine kinase